LKVKKNVLKPKMKAPCRSAPRRHWVNWFFLQY